MCKQSQATQDTWSNRADLVQFSVHAGKQHLLDLKGLRANMSLCLLVAKEGNVLLFLIFSDNVSHTARAHTCPVILVFGNIGKN